MFPSSSKQFRAQGFRKRLEILDIHETSASEIEFYETSNSETDMAVDHFFMVVCLPRIRDLHDYLLKYLNDLSN